jgi:UDP-N-acetylglucosamine 2-epimerase
VLLAQRPEWVLIYGDTNSTLAGALAAAKLQMPLAHVEAGLRSYNRAMPEEHNRVLADHCSDLLFCPTQTAVDNLAREGLTLGVHLVGDVMYDAVMQHGSVARQQSTLLNDLGLTGREFALATIHRPYNTEDPARLREILNALGALDMPVVFPIHTRTRDRLARMGNPQSAIRNLQSVDPLGYLDMLALEQAAALILTDSGGVQKEAYFFAVPCVTLRPETEWVETVDAGWNRLAWGDADVVIEAARRPWPAEPPDPVFGDGHAAEHIVDVLAQHA